MKLSFVFVAWQVVSTIIAAILSLLFYKNFKKTNNFADKYYALGFLFVSITGIANGFRSNLPLVILGVRLLPGMLIIYFFAKGGFFRDILGIVNKKEANNILFEQVARLKKMSYQELQETYLDKSVGLPEINSPSREKYTIEVFGKYHNKKKNHIEIDISIYRGIWCKSSSFIIAPDGKIIKEE